MHLQPSKCLEETRYYTEEIPRLKGRVAIKLEKLHKFDRLIREYGDFCILDIDPGIPDGNAHAVYRAGRSRYQRFILMIVPHGPRFIAFEQSLTNTFEQKTRDAGKSRAIQSERQ